MKEEKKTIANWKSVFIHWSIHKLQHIVQDFSRGLYLITIIEELQFQPINNGNEITKGVQLLDDTIILSLNSIAWNLIKTEIVAEAEKCKQHALNKYHDYRGTIT